MTPLLSKTRARRHSLVSLMVACAVGSCAKAGESSGSLRAPPPRGMCQDRYFCDPVSGKGLLSTTRQRFFGDALRAMNERPLPEHSTTRTDALIRCTLVPGAGGVKIATWGINGAVLLGKQWRGVFHADGGVLVTERTAQLSAEQLDRLRALSLRYLDANLATEESTQHILHDGDTWLLEVLHEGRYVVAIRKNELEPPLVDLCMWMFERVGM